MENKKVEYSIITEQGDMGLFVPLNEEEQDTIRKKKEEEKNK